jgi:hypothetical protein
MPPYAAEVFTGVEVAFTGEAEALTGVEVALYR